MSPHQSSTLEREEHSPSRQVLQDFSLEHTRAIEQGLLGFFHGKEEESKLVQARRILGDSAANFSDEELEAQIGAFQFLIDCWLDSFERSIFNNLTLSQLLKGD